ncbi:sensor histidine kinase [Oceaniglobus indicus]|uniref:sensor histidine kinase n=1 Tax=Oceaniglobus indicus TaxID=2047749 RepID=UPI000C1A10BE|nr:HAMP domain-containing sensor histidine kinase [Oceaniglobus indicus]
MTPWRSVSLRLTLAVAGGIMALSLSALGLQYHALARALEARQSAVLAADVAAFSALYDQRRIVALREAIEFRADVTPPGTAVFLLQGKAGETLAGNIDAWPDGLPALASGVTMDGAQHFDLAGVPYVGIARVLPGGFPFLAARGRGEVESVLATQRGVMLLTALALAVMAGVAGWVVARLVMGRIDRLNALADRVAAGDLAARLPGARAPDEFGRLEHHVHRMLDRIEALNRATLRLSDNIAHELRTPLSRIMQKLDRSEADDAVRDEMRNAIRIFDSLLDISGAEAAAGQTPGLVPVDLGEVVGEVAELYAPLAEDSGLDWRCDIAPGLWVLGDRNLIAQAVSNLADNAIKFCRPGDAVTLTLAAQAGRHVLEVRDTGPGLPDELGDAAFERFARAERDREVAGHGLGLALVQAIAARHGARLTRPPVATGFAISIAWPPLAQQPPLPAA